MSNTPKNRREQLEDENILVDESLGEFFTGVSKVLYGLQLPTVYAVLKSFMKACVVTAISAILFSIIDSIVAPVARFLLNG